MKPRSDLRTRQLTRRRDRHLPMYANTMHGLQHWYHREFEKLGWMVIANAKGYDYKVTAYKKNLQNLKKSLEHVMEEYQDPDRKHDLAVLHMNLMCLIDHVNKDFKSA